MLKDYLHLHFIIVIWGFTAILGKLISIPAVELVFYRTLIAAIGVGILFVVTQKRASLWMFATTRPLPILSVGFLISLHWILFFGAARVSNVSVCLAGIATCSLWTSLLEPLMMHRRVRWYEVMLGLLIIVGLYIIFRFEFNHFTGLLMAIGSAFCASLFTVINGKLAKKHHPYLITFYEMSGAFFCTVLFLPFYSWLLLDGAPLQLQPRGQDWLWIATLALVCTVYAYSASVELMKRISPFTMNLSVNMEPIYGIIMAVIFFRENENMTTGFYIGTAIILFSVLIYPWLKQIDEKRLLKAGG